jgi:fermentation-respiration switch protein FrsA (DUF1100 family)
LLAEQRKHFDADRVERWRGESPVMVPILPDLKPLGDGVIDDFREVGNQGLLWFGYMRRDRLQRWRNELTLRSAELYSEYEPGSYIARIGPTPLLIITGDHDTLTPTDEILTAYKEAQEPKRLLIVHGGHYDLYGISRPAGSEAALEWFSHHLKRR